jgi:Pyruvate/2-oxoacid:ferredoxin oxidoreductase delta subunit
MALIKKSTKDMWKVQGEGAKGFLRVFNMIHGYLYYTIYDHYVMGASTILRWLGRHPNWNLSKDFYNYILERYHCKVMVPQSVDKLLRIDQDFTVPQEVAKRVVPFPLANKIIIKNYDALAFVDCPCRMEKAALGRNPCQPINTCLFFGKMGTDFVTTHMPRMHARKVTQEEALKQLKQNWEKGYALTIWSKDATGYRSGVLCSCCSCCCFGTEVERMARNIPGLKDIKITAPSGFSVVTDSAKCNLSGQCISTCPYLAREIVDTPKGKKLVFHYDLCMGCGACTYKCPTGAITLVRDEKKGDIWDVEAFDKNVKLKPKKQDKEAKSSA